MEVTCNEGSLFHFKRGIYEKTGKTTGIRNCTDITSGT